MAQAKSIHSELVGVRETFESIWVAIILAFVLRAFILEAFVIPTGSMAPRLLGQHVLLRCPSCGYQFAYGIDESNVPRPGRPFSGPLAVCPNCREKISYNDAELLSGDRVLVLKYFYKFLPPQTWDVVVFHNPQGPMVKADNAGNLQYGRDNYIKRLIGLPGEEVRIIHGDVFKRFLQDFNHDGIKDERDLQTPEGQQLPWKIVRKGLQTQQAMWQLVFDNDYQPVTDRRRIPWSPLWRTPSGQVADGWHLDLVGGREFYFDGKQPESLYFARSRRDIFQPTYGYNNSSVELRPSPSDICSDLKLETVLAPKTAEGEISLTLSNLEHQFQADIRFDGKLTLRHRLMDANGKPTSEWQTWGETTVKPFQVGEAVPVALTHVDWKVALLVDGKPCIESNDDVYKPDVNDLVKRVKQADNGDASAIPTPVVGILATSGQFELWHTSVMRDVFYTSPSLQHSPPSDNYGYRFVPSTQYPPLDETGHEIPSWGSMDSPIVLRQYADKSDLDEFFMCGDNSPASWDGRLWITADNTLRLFDEQGQPQYRLGTVPRYSLIGRAFFVYWPAGHRLPGLALPLVPNVGKMRLIH